MTKVENKETDNNRTTANSETTAFNATTHIAFLQTKLEFLDQDFDDWCVCLIEDNCNLNQRIAKDWGKPLIGCYSHKLNL